MSSLFVKRLVTLAVVGSMLSPTLAAGAEVVITDKARTHFQAGVSFMSDPDGARYEDAFREFQAAYEESPSWKILGNLGLCAMKLERDGEAIDAFIKYLEEGGDELDSEERAQVERDLSTLKASTVVVTLKTVPENVRVSDQRVPVRGNPVNNRYLSDTGELRLSVRPGHHRITVSAPGYVEQSWDFDAATGTEHEHTFELQKKGATQPTAPGPQATPAATPAQPAASNSKQATHRPIPTSVYLVGGATLLLGAGATIAGLNALNRKQDLEDARARANPDVAEIREAEDNLTNANLFADGLLAGAVVGASATVVLYLTRPEEPIESGQLRWTPVAAPRYAGVHFSGSF